ncbi:MAG: helix-turn-helix transcriptional regulator [Pseudomonadota bacterium]
MTGIVPAFSARQDNQRSVLIKVADIRPVLSIAERDGVNAIAILHRYGANIADPDARLSLVNYFKVERDIARATDDLTAHLSTRKLTYQTGSFVVDQVKKAKTLADAISSLADYFNMMHGGTYNLVQRTSQTITLSIDDRAFPYSVREPDALVQLIGECVQIKVHCLLDSLSDGLAASALMRVSIPRQTLHGQAEHLTFWPRKPQTGRETYALTYNLAVARTAIPRPEGLDLSSDGIFSRVIDVLEAMNDSERENRLTDRILDLIEDGGWRQDRVAEHFNISVATLRRRLSEDGHSFRELVQAARLRRAEALLLKGHTTQQVTDAIGYSDIRAFNRAFKRWKGRTPASFAREHAAEA